MEKISWFWARARGTRRGLRFFVCKYFVVRLSTTKTTKILPLEKYPLYGSIPLDEISFRATKILFTPDVRLVVCLYRSFKKAIYIHTYSLVAQYIKSPASATILRMALLWPYGIVVSGYSPNVNCHLLIGLQLKQLAHATGYK